MTSAREISISEGRVRGLVFGETETGVRYAKVRLAARPEYYMDFDDPDPWTDLKGASVRITWMTQESRDGYVYRVVLEWEPIDDAL